MIQDLELDILLNTMAQGDSFLRTIARQVLLSSLEDPQVIRYRQMILQDCLNNPDAVRAPYQIPVQALITKQKQWLGIFSLYPSSILSSAVELLEMFVGAESFAANCCRALFTHYKREEDVTMKSGKFDEELGRMSEIVNWLKPNALILFNESLAATNEHGGSKITHQIVTALISHQFWPGCVSESLLLKPATIRKPTSGLVVVDVI